MPVRYAKLIFLFFHAVPVLEIDGNIVINDTYDIHKYLIEHYPGKGNASLNEEQKALQEEFIETNLLWDEYLFSYRRVPKFLGGAMHQIRLVELSKSIYQAMSDGLLDKKLMDGRTVQQAYIDKVAQTRALIRIGCDDDILKQINNRIIANDEQMNAVLKKADQLLAAQEVKNGISDTLLLTDEDDKLTSADVYFAVFLKRISTVDGLLIKHIFSDYPRIEKWWAYFNTLEEAKKLKESADPLKLMKMLLFTGKPVKFALYGVGLLSPKPLPDDVEKEVVKEFENLMTNYFKT